MLGVLFSTDLTNFVTKNMKHNVVFANFAIRNKTIFKNFDSQVQTIFFVNLCRAPWGPISPLGAKIHPLGRAYATKTIRRSHQVQFHP
jgi:hypothetical protein